MNTTRQSSNDKTTQVRYLYLRDDKTDRVVTVARMVDFDNRIVKFAFSVNRISTKEVYNELSYREEKKFSGDRFNKSMGREIAHGRLMKEGEFYFAATLSDKRPIETILTFLANSEDNVPMCVREIAAEALLTPMPEHTPRNVSQTPAQLADTFSNE